MPSALRPIGEKHPIPTANTVGYSGHTIVKKAVLARAVSNPTYENYSALFHEFTLYWFVILLRIQSVSVRR
jgi:hypothetical protein